VRLPALIARPYEPQMKQRARELLDRVGLADRAEHTPAELSGGQQQRAAIARALMNQPAVVFADEPTGNLDRAGSLESLDLLRRSVSDSGQTIVMVTHDPYVAAIADRILFLEDGRVVRELHECNEDTIIGVMKELTAT